ncbi:hypothetical protein Baya_5403 [Bagarius yarrelli]|uniref:Uncharacterized protein n=1 Tax=Bagarius yarrelli TaxID=175774 RepID=A0A556TWR2_BAGYA|nr:hypothetical protein Baya_5403 [Bagarius yarrelli]
MATDVRVDHPASSKAFSGKNNSTVAEKKNQKSPQEHRNRFASCLSRYEFHPASDEKKDKAGN